MTTWETIARENADALRRVIELHRAKHEPQLNIIICRECQTLYPCQTIHVMGSLND